MKKLYEAPFAELEEIITEDVILTSGETHSEPETQESQSGIDLPEDEF